MPDSEFALIQDYFTGGAEGPAVCLGIGDDAAVLAVPEAVSYTHLRAHET